MSQFGGSTKGWLRWLGAAGLPLCAATAAAEPPPPASAPPVPAPAASRDAPGFLDAFNRWLDESAANFKSGMKDSQQTLNNWTAGATEAAKAAKEATDALVKLPTARMVTGRELCQMAPNGSPDCRAAADAICSSKGYGAGKSLDTQTAQKCPARVWLSGRMPAEGECPIETHVVRAVCQ